MPRTQNQQVTSSSLFFSELCRISSFICFELQVSYVYTEKSLKKKKTSSLKVHTVCLTCAGMLLAVFLPRGSMDDNAAPCWDKLYQAPPPLPAERIQKGKAGKKTNRFWSSLRGEGPAFDANTCKADCRTRVWTTATTSPPYSPTYGLKPYTAVQHTTGGVFLGVRANITIKNLMVLCEC